MVAGAPVQHRLSSARGSSCCLTPDVANVVPHRQQPQDGAPWDVSVSVRRLPSKASSTAAIAGARQSHAGVNSLHDADAVAPVHGITKYLGRRWGLPFVMVAGAPVQHRLSSARGSSCCLTPDVANVVPHRQQPQDGAPWDVSVSVRRLPSKASSTAAIAGARQSHAGVNSLHDAGESFYASAGSYSAYRAAKAVRSDRFGP
ncbi:hypothetical protein ISCGN_009763 [Ixodes scapularis]